MVKFEEIIGRDEEISKLEELIDEASEGKGNIFLLNGYVGIGKTRIIQEITRIAKKKDIPIVGRIPYDISITKAMVDGKTIIEFSNNGLSKKFREMWDEILKRIDYDRR